MYRDYIIIKEINEYLPNDISKYIISEYLTNVYYMRYEENIINIFNMIFTVKDNTHNGRDSFKYRLIKMFPDLFYGHYRGYKRLYSREGCELFTPYRKKMLGATIKENLKRRCKQCNEMIENKLFGFDQYVTLHDECYMEYYCND